MSIFPRIYEPLTESIHKSLYDWTNQSFRTSKISKYRYYSKDVIIHESAGGGLGSAKLLSKLEITNSLLEKLKKISEKISHPIIGIHFRSLDWGGSKPDYLNYVISSINEEVPILVASDNFEIRTELSKRFPTKKFEAVSEILDNLNESYSKTELAVLELLTLSLCDELTLIPLLRE